MAYTYSVIITGGTNGIGYHAALKIAKDHPEYLVVIASRSDKNNAADAINKALGQSNTIFMTLDLGSPADVRSFAKNWIADKTKPQIQALVMNAALQFPKTLHLTDEGVEKTFAISHVGHAILFHLLCPYLATGARVVLTSSGTHDPAQNSGLPDVEGVTGKYFEGLREIKSSIDSYVERKQEDLWEWTVNYVAEGDAREVGRFQSFK
ncbi:hypothetical protein INS49_012736 [Diaporthe citri]|uniref:uncharacterized protein n=1 Tax=Diaporthe citri TaxID=83186 RepID=UPI001C81422C|nr:uncharacterized protein INS49_012736 [Diaporthe citri]KAG6359215.1 hypothetical protein INS49_012736 [Diaporthe citri]